MNTVTQTRQEAFEENAIKATEFGGKRFLGFTKNGAEVWISAYLNKETKEIKIESTHNLSSLLDDGAEFASRRVNVERNKTLYQDVKSVIMSLKRDRGGRVTERTLQYLDTLMSMSQTRGGKGFVKGKPSTLFIKYVFDAIFTGNLEPSEGGFRVAEIMKLWGFPKGEYFTVNYNTTIT
jgi:hypothetical protein